MVKQYQLKNGLQVLLIESHKSPVVSLHRGRVRLTPDGILAGSSSREESIALLREHGYLI